MLLFHVLSVFLIDWCCFYQVARNSLVAFLEALCARCIPNWFSRSRAFSEFIFNLFSRIRSGAKIRINFHASCTAVLYFNVMYFNFVYWNYEVRDNIHSSIHMHSTLFQVLPYPFWPAKLYISLSTSSRLMCVCVCVCAWDIVCVSVGSVTTSHKLLLLWLLVPTHVFFSAASICHARTQISSFIFLFSLFSGALFLEELRRSACCVFESPRTCAQWRAYSTGKMFMSIWTQKLY